MNNKKRMAFDIDSNIFQATKMLALKRNVSFSDFMSSVVTDFLKSSISDDEKQIVSGLIEEKVK